MDKMKPSKEHENRLIEKLKKNYTFFSNFDHTELEHIFKVSERENFKDGEVIFKEGDIGNKMYIIISGCITISKKKDASCNEQIALLTEGDCFGEMGIIDSSPRSATATANTHCILFSISDIILKNTNIRLCLKLYKNLAMILAERLRRVDNKVTSAY